MNGKILMIGLAAVAIFTSMGTEAVKKILDDLHVKYSANILAAIVAVVLTIGASVGYIIYMGEAVTLKICVEIAAMTFLSFLCATVGYDKVIQAIKQLKQLSGDL